MRAPKLLIWVLLVQVLVGGAFVFAASNDFFQDDVKTSPEKPPSNTTTFTIKNGWRDRFDEDRAFRLLREQVVRYGPRPAGSRSLRRLAGRLRRLLPNGRFERIPGHPRLRNVVGHLPGRKPAILIAAHYDTKDEPKGFVGANDGAGGTAAVVELARTLRGASVDQEVRFVLFDGEESPRGCDDFLRCGVRGSRAYARRHADELQALILLDFIAEKDLRIPREGTSDIELWAQLRAAARRVGHEDVFPDEVGDPIQDDHTPFLEAGVRSINLIDFDFPQWHTRDDDMDVVSAQSLDAAGETVAQLVLDWQW